MRERGAQHFFGLRGPTGDARLRGRSSKRASAASNRPSTALSRALCRREYASIAIPGRVVVQRMEQAAQELLRAAGEAGLTAEEVAWVESLVQYGEFLRFRVSRAWSPEEARRVGEHATGMGIVRGNADG